MFKNYINILFNKLKHHASGIQYFNKTTKIIPSKKSKIDDKKIQQLLLQEYTERLLQTMKVELQKTYAEERTKEHSMKPHTKQHNEIIQYLREIKENLSKVEDELDLLEENTEKIRLQIDADLGLTERKPLLKKTKLN